MSAQGQRHYNANFSFGCLAVAILAFGFWQKSVGAGLWMGGLLLFLSQCIGWHAKWLTHWSKGEAAPELDDRT